LIKKIFVCLVAVLSFSVLGCNPAAPPKDRQNNADFVDQNAVKANEAMKASTDPKLEDQNQSAAVGGNKLQKYLEQNQKQQDQ
jgi:hypothetical protein